MTIRDIAEFLLLNNEELRREVAPKMKRLIKNKHMYQDSYRDYVDRKKALVIDTLKKHIMSSFGLGVDEVLMILEDDEKINKIMEKLFYDEFKYVD